MLNNVDDILDERGKRYGRFEDHARIAQDLKLVIREYGGFEKTQPDQREALEMICHKIARIINGDPDYVESWRDIAGYAQLVASRLRETDGATDAEVKHVTRANGVWS